VNSRHPARSRPIPSKRWTTTAAVLAGSAVLAACGSSTTTGPSSAAGGAQQPAPPVAVVDSNVTAQMLAAAPRSSSHSDEAAFTLRAYTAGGRPAADESVSWWVGPMAPLSGVHPAHWLQAGSASAATYVASASATTDASGEARIVLFGQPAKAMEMVAVRVGDLNSYDQSLGRGIGLLDAWWTTPSTTPTAPVGYRVTLSPFLAADGPGQRTVFHVHVADASGAPINGAGVNWVPQPAAGKASAGSSMGSSAVTSPGMATMASTKAVTDPAGNATYSFQRPANGNYCGLRVVVTQPGSHGRVAGGMASELLTPS
jgi:hypothetical protein